jgi:diguanylate cyclase (GGDEF)-like protein/PAS domain S-box-containing protein
MSDFQSTSAVASVQQQPPLSLKLLLKNLPGAVYRCLSDSEWTMEFVSDGIENLTGYSSEAFTLPPRLSFASLIHAEDRSRVERTIAQALQADSSFQLTYRIRCANSHIKWVWEQGALAVTNHDSTNMIEGFIADITRTRISELVAREQASFLERARDAIVVIDMDSNITYWNRGAEHLYGWTAAEAHGGYFYDLICHDKFAYARAHETALTKGEWSGELTHRRRDGETLEVESSWTLLEADHVLGIPRKILIISADVGERKKNEAKIHHLAFFDALTGLPNRAHFLDHLHQAIVGCARTGRCGALLFCDLDNFKFVNDTEGHATGDMLLQVAAQRLKNCVRETDMVARFAGDEFVVLLQPSEATEVAAAVQAEIVAAKIVSSINSSIYINNKTMPVSVSVGVTTLGGRENTLESVLSDADAAMYQAKVSGRNTFRFHDPAIQAHWLARTELEQDLWRALTHHEFILYYQPQLDHNNHVIGAEALLRWRLSNGKIVYPSDFIKLAEESNLIVEIGTWVLRTACDQLAGWQRSSETSHLSLSVNVSVRQFTALGFVSNLESILEETAVDPRGLKLELTENLLIRDFAKTAEIMTLLKRRGISFSLDDFGTGYSSLAYLRKLPIDQLKIDHIFMRDVLTNQGDASIVRSIIGLAVNLGLQVIAEGVETLGQRNFLSDAGCFLYQGFLYKKAIEATHFVQYAQNFH